MTLYSVGVYMLGKVRENTFPIIIKVLQKAAPEVAPTIAAPMARWIVSWQWGTADGIVSKLSKKLVVERSGYEAFIATQKAFGAAPDNFSYPEIIDNGGAFVLKMALVLKSLNDEYRTNGNVGATKAVVEVAETIGHTLGWQFGRHITPSLVAPAARYTANWAWGTTPLLFKNGIAERAGHKTFGVARAIAPAACGFAGGLAIKSGVTVCIQRMQSNPVATEMEFAQTNARLKL